MLSGALDEHSEGGWIDVMDMWLMLVLILVLLGYGHLDGVASCSKGGYGLCL